MSARFYFLNWKGKLAMKKLTGVFCLLALSVMIGCAGDTPKAATDEEGKQSMDATMKMDTGAAAPAK